MFLIHFVVFAIVTGALAALNLSRTPNHLWFHYVAFGWGLGVAFHGIDCMISHRSQKEIHEQIGRLGQW